MFFAVSEEITKENYNNTKKPKTFSNCCMSLSLFASVSVSLQFPALSFPTIPKCQENLLLKM